MKRTRIAVLGLSSLILASIATSCGPSEESSTSELPLDPSWSQNSGSYSFKTNPVFAGADSLPSIDSVVAFCPVSSTYNNVYLWDSDGTLPTGSSTWPGIAMTKNYDDTWYEVDLASSTKTNIIFNKSGSPQTQDMSITHSGYWWFWLSDGNIHDTVPATAWIQTAKFSAEGVITVVSNVNMTSFSLYEGDDVILTGTPSCNAIDISLNKHEADLSKGYRVVCNLEGGTASLSMNVDINLLYGTDSFNETYAYDGADLGVTYSSAQSTFKVWSPFSSSIALRVYSNGTPTSVSASKGNDVYVEYPMTKGAKGVFSTSVSGDLSGKYYTYVVTNSSYTEKEVVDPYAKAVGVNGKRGEILDLASTDPTGWDSVTVNPYDRKELTVWECHIADLTSSSTWTGSVDNAKKYAGFHESGTTYTQDGVTVKTGFDHVKELGVNAVQILPMFDQDNDETTPAFNWGYNPLNYNAPEGVYSSDPYDGAVRISELKALIADYVKAGINIIMDVVYNHVSSAKASNFDVLVPGYYFRYTTTGAFSNGSGCGNETASEHYMMRKFIVDSASYWASEYKLGGFRFDLMGLHDLTTMEDVVASCKKINPNICVYGEPWMGGSSSMDYSTSAKQSNGNQWNGYGGFNDVFRDSLIKGGLHSSSEIGWATAYKTDDQSADVANVVAGLKGTANTNDPIADPDKSVNYVTCHDNYTLYDRIYMVVHANAVGPKMAMLANSVIFTSQGTTFMLSGDEFLRTKSLNSNSYNASYKINELNYALKIKNISMFGMYQKLVALKQGVDGLHLDKTGAAALSIATSGGNEIVYEIKDTANSKTYKIVHADGFGTPANVDFTGYTSVYLDTLNSGVSLSSSTAVQNYQTIIAVK